MLDMLTRPDVLDHVRDIALLELQLYVIESYF